MGKQISKLIKQVCCHNELYELIEYNGYLWSGPERTPAMWVKLDSSWESLFQRTQNYTAAIDRSMANARLELMWQKVCACERERERGLLKRQRWQAVR